MNWLQQMVTLTPEAERGGIFRAGDDVVVAEGPFQSTPGVFLKLTDDDANWAEIKEYNGIVRSHPVIWLRHSRAFHAAVQDCATGPGTQRAA